MSKLTPDIGDLKETVTLLLLAEVLTRRGERGPLARVIYPTPAPPRRSRPMKPPGSDGGTEEPR